MARLVQLIMALSLWLALSVAASGQNPIQQYDQSVDDYVALIQEKHKDFRLIKNTESFPKRINAQEPIHIETKPKRAIAGLHDMQTGAPLESCKTPCTLHTDGVRDYIVVLYKAGHAPLIIPTMGGAWAHDWTRISLGIDYFDVVQRAAKCSRTFNSKTKVDGDARPCVRVPPIMPPHAKQSGHCIVKYDVMQSGKTANHIIKECTDDYYGDASVDSIKWWFYTPKVDRGMAIDQPGIETKISFKLTDESGALIQ